MKELLDILNESSRLAEAGQPYALATVVKIGGSTYRRPGARMLVTSDGNHRGTISGGCLEGEVAMQAIDVIENGRARLIPFDLEDDDIVLGFGAGCNGVVHVLIQPIAPDHTATPVDALNLCIRERQSGVLATVIAGENQVSDHTGKFALLLEGDRLGPSTLSEDLAENILKHSRIALSQTLNGAQMYTWHTEQIDTSDGTVEVLYEIVRPPVQLFIFGEGHDVRAVLQQTDAMGWRTVIVGRKPVEVLKDRFPEASDWIFLMHPDQALEHVDPDTRSAALVMNHTYVRDKSLLKALLLYAIPFVGMLGPRERTTEMMAEYASEGWHPTDEVLARLYGPVGLDIGTETPEEIALAAVAEIQAVLHGRKGGSLRDRETPIHTERNPIESVY